MLSCYPLHERLTYMDELLAHLPAHSYFQPHDILFVYFVHVQRFRPGHVCSFRRVSFLFFFFIS
ncbi:hypothetical protein BDV36DRAFT_276809 [Aspergillus pseudocaelatus]|uniref:Uncharacterized protein n=1 Tax=Aspergillus pseudocaelatus TaxID=1825620 RepID=A0ABQ6W0X1_9EURO|nr:hypothetical protein BDV36DRAFT_276809 [Aspergillus pseudocaelatus]